MTTFPKTLANKFALFAGTGWDFSFRFAVLSPVLGILIGFLALLLFYH